MAAVSLKKLEKVYPNGFKAVHGVDLDVRDGEFMVFVGPSGCAKSTLLRMVAGLESISGGELHIGGRAVNDLPPKQRGIAMVFQNYALYPHMTVYDNLGFGLKLAKTPKAELDQHAELMKKHPGMEHDEPYMAHVAAGKKGDIVWHFNRAGSFDFACLIPGHYQAGMTGTITVLPRNP